MGNIIDYINEYGHLDFIDKPFNDVDGLILSQFSYLKMDGIVPEVGTNSESIELRDIAVHEHLGEMFSDERYAKNNKEFFNALALSRRFGLIRLNHYINLISRKWEMQFSAVCCELSDGTTCVVYRGTDETIIGWKEDFNMAYLTPIPAQIKAVDYLNYVSERISGSFIVGGHSKGGNLSVYAAMKSPIEIRNRITKILSYDGPGFLKETLECSDFADIKSRITKLVPGSSIVGMLLQTQEDYGVVECKHFGILQHDPFNWIVEGDDFVRRSDVKDSFVLQNKVITEWATTTDPQTMRAFSNQLFDVVIKSGIDDLNDIKGNYTELIRQFTLALEDIDDNEKEMLKTIGKSLMSSIIETIKTQSGKARLGE